MVAAASASAQEVPEPAVPKAAPEIVAIPLVEISQHAEQTALVLKTASDSLPMDADVTDIATQIEKIERSLKERRGELERGLARGQNRDRLADYQAEWDQTIAELESWGAKLGPMVLRVESALGSLSEEKEVWEHTRKNAEGAKSPESIVKRIRTTLGGIDKGNAAANDKQTALLTLQDRIVQQNLVATRALDQIQAAQREGRSGLFQRDAPPLWSDLRGVQRGEHLDDVRDSIAGDLRKLREFAAASGSQFLLDLLIFIVVVRYAFAVKRKLADPVEGIPPVGHSGELFERPVSIALLAMWSGKCDHVTPLKT